MNVASLKGLDAPAPSPRTLKPALEPQGCRDLGFRVWGFRELGFRVWGLGFGVCKIDPTTEDPNESSTRACQENNRTCGEDKVT